MHRQTVEISQWLTDRQFSELFAIAQAAPGPNVMFVALLGHFIAGVPGAIVTTVAMCGPTCFLAYGVSRVFDRFRAARWRIAIQAGLVPVTIGLIAASALIIARAADHDLARFRRHGGDVRLRLLDADLASGGVRGRRRCWALRLCDCRGLCATRYQPALSARARPCARDSLRA